MNTLAIDKPASRILKRDCDGNTYSLPQYEVNAFVMASEILELTEFMTDEWHAAIDELNSRFGEFRIE
jgi:hypothetical protein